MTQTTDELVEVCRRADEIEMPFVVLGGGANILVSDAGVRGLVIINRAKEIKFTARGVQARVEVDSGANLITLARDCIERGYAAVYVFFGYGTTIGALGVRQTVLYGPESGYLGLGLNLVFAIAVLQLWKHRRANTPLL